MSSLVRRPDVPGLWLRKGANHPFVEPGGFDAKAHVESGSQVAEGDDVGEFDELRSIEMPAELFDEILGDFGWCAAQPVGVVEDQLVDFVEEVAGLVVA